MAWALRSPYLGRPTGPEGVASRVIRPYMVISNTPVVLCLLERGIGCSGGKEEPRQGEPDFPRFNPVLTPI